MSVLTTLRGFSPPDVDRLSFALLSVQLECFAATLCVRHVFRTGAHILPNQTSQEILGNVIIQSLIDDDAVQLFILELVQVIDYNNVMKTRFNQNQIGWQFY